MKNFKKLLFLISIILILFLCLASVNASDITENTVSDSNSEIISITDDASADLLVEDNSVNELKISAEEKDQITVKNSNSGSDLGISASNNAKSFTQLAQDINNAGSILNLNSDYKYNNSSDRGYQSRISISKNLTINGNNHIIEGNNLSKVFDVWGKLILKSITFVNCGGAIYNDDDGILSVVNCSFVNCNSSSGGAIYNDDDGILSVVNCSFVNCNSSSGGAIYNRGILSVVNCSFVNCNSSSGGAIYNSRGNLSVVDSGFVNCSAGSSGGAVYNSRDNLSVVNCSFVNCNSSSGGAIYNDYKGILSVVDSGFVNCSSSYSGAVYNRMGNLSVVDSGFVNCSGAVSNFRGNLSVVRGSFVNCSAGSSGGAVYNNGILSVVNCSFVNCNSSSGGAIYNNYEGILSVVNCSFVNCSADDGGAVYNYEGIWSVVDSGFVNCSASSYGGAVHNSGGNLSIDNISFVNCSAGSYGGAISNNYRGNLSIVDSGFVNCSAKYDGGAVYNLRGNLSVVDSGFVNCSAGSSGGAIYNEGNLSLENNTVFSEFAKIFNKGIINSTLNILILDNETYYIKLGGTVKLTAKLTDDNGNLIYDESLNILFNSKIINTTFNRTSNLYEASLEILDNKLSLVTTNILGSNVNTKTSLIHVLDEFYLNITTRNILYGENVDVGVGINRDCTGRIGVFIVGENGYEYNITRNLNEFEGKVILEDLDSGVYNISVYYYGDNNYDPFNVSKFFEVYKCTPDLTVEMPKELVYGEDAILKVCLTGFNDSKLNNTVTIRINKNYYYLKVVNGTGILTLSNLLPNNYFVSANVNGSSNYNYASTDFDFTVSKSNNVKFTVDAKDIIYGDNLNIIISLSGMEGILNGNVELHINNEKYDVKVINGHGDISIPNLPSKNYHIFAIFNNTYYDAQSNAVNINIAKTPIKILAVTKKVGGGAVKKTIQFILKTKSGKVLANKVVKLTINKRTYSAKTNSKGLVIFKAYLPKAGSYACTVRFNGDDNCRPLTWKVKIKVLKSLTTVKAPKVSGVRGTTKYFKVTVKYYKSKKVVKGLKLKVKVAGKSYVIKTNSKGVAMLNIKNIKKGTHKVVISSKNSKFYVKKTSKIVMKNPVVKRTYKSSSGSRSSYSSSYTPRSSSTSSSSSSSTSRSFSINNV